MTDEQLESWGQKFEEADANSSGKLGLSEFLVFFPDIIPGIDEEGAKRYFRGIDVDGSGTVSRDEFLAFVKAALTKDKVYTLKLVFRSFDQNRNGILEPAEIKEIGRYVGTELDEQQIEDKIQEVAGESATGLTFKQVAKVLLGVDIPDTEPVDEKSEQIAPEAEAAPAAAPKPEEQKKSGCCLLL
jgi:Ca2+-binding EF-hand superfamily protein